MAPLDVFAAQYRQVRSPRHSCGAAGLSAEHPRWRFLCVSPSNLSYLLSKHTDGMIIFPSTGVFSGLGAMGVSMFFISCIVSQLVYTLGGSAFASANGSMMIEVVVRLFICA